jgi:metacaspase-1
MNQKTALCIGINYIGTPSELSGCANDASDWTAALGARGYNVATMLDADATKLNMLTEITRLVQATKFGDTCVITYSGHGTYVADTSGDEADGRDEALCPIDVFQSGAIITDDELYDIFNDRHHGARVIFISDSCHSGTVMRFVGETVDQQAPKVRFMPPMSIPKLPRKMQPQGRGINPIMPTRSSAALVSGCRDFEYSFDAWINGRWNGAMTRHAINSLNDLGNGATLKQWHAELRKRLPTQQYPQQPQLQGTSSQKKWKL